MRSSPRLGNPALDVRVIGFNLQETLIGAEVGDIRHGEGRKNSGVHARPQSKFHVVGRNDYPVKRNIHAGFGPGSIGSNALPNAGLS
jgi:hypothetical protein